MQNTILSDVNDYDSDYFENRPLHVYDGPLLPIHETISKRRIKSMHRNHLGLSHTARRMPTVDHIVDDDGTPRVMFTDKIGTVIDRLQARRYLTVSEVIFNTAIAGISTIVRYTTEQGLYAVPQPLASYY